jgi:hypothetical protein
MPASTSHPLADQYLKDIQRAAQRLPHRQRAELLSEIAAHVEHGLIQAHGEAAVRNLLDQLGEPEDIVAAAAQSASPDGPRRAWLALALGLFGVACGLVPVVGAFVAIPSGIAAATLGFRARRDAQSIGAPTAASTGAILAGLTATIAPLVFLAAFLALNPVGVGGEANEGNLPAVQVPTADKAYDRPQATGS